MNLGDDRDWHVVPLRPCTARPHGPAATAASVVQPVEYLTPAIEDGAVEALALLAGRGPHRAPSTPLLIIAAPAELTGITVRHVTRTSRSSPRSRHRTPRHTVNLSYFISAPHKAS